MLEKLMQATTLTLLLHLLLASKSPASLQTTAVSVQQEISTLTVSFLR